MCYEPIGYIYEYEISALLFLVVVMVRYFMADMILDIVSSLIIDHVFSVPVALTYIVNIVFYSLQIFLPLIMTMYLYAMVEKLDRKHLRRFLPLLLPGAVMLLMLFSTPIIRWFFYVDPQQGYVHGKLFKLTYMACLFYMFVTVAMAFKNRSKLRKIEFRTICWFMVIVLAAVIVQYLYPPLLISGVAVAVAVILMYFTLQNPETMIDITTGAFTADAMFQFLHDRLREKRPVNIVAIKIRNMPRINELLGIENGSLLLREICRLLQSKNGDAWVFRMRGSIFVGMADSKEGYLAMRNATDDRIDQPWHIGGTEILVHATVCSVTSEGLPEELLTPSRAINYIESALLQNDHSANRINYVTVGADFVDRLKRRKEVEEALREAIETGVGLEPYYQPIWSVGEERFVGAEALLRFKHPKMGMISPDEFVPIAESCGFVTAMDSLVIKKVCAFISENRQIIESKLSSVEINLSALEFMTHRLPQLLRETMSEHDVPPSFLCFEITETAATDSFKLLSECMGELMDCGCSFALDDFGTGYANISQVIQLPFAVVKLDRSLLLGSESVMEDLARMFARMGLRIVVEGVETAGQAALCREMQVDYIQGYYYARPMCGKDFLAFLQNGGNLNDE